jgi:SAM-dependent methyltransferase
MLRKTALAILLALAAPQAFALEEVPFITTPDNVTIAMLQIANVGSQDFVLDLGSGDGRIVITAAKRFGARGLGVEIVPDLVQKSREAALAARVSDRAHFREQDLFKSDLSLASVVTMYLLPDVNLQLRPRLLALRPGTRIVSHDWDMAEWEPDKVVKLDVPDKKIGREKSSKVMLWIVPARIDGDWCAAGRHRGTMLHIDQNFQKLRGVVSDKDDRREFEGRIEGSVVRVPGGLAFTYDGTRLKATYAGAKYSPLKNATFSRRRGPSCK